LSIFSKNLCGVVVKFLNKSKVFIHPFFPILADKFTVIKFLVKGSCLTCETVIFEIRLGMHSINDYRFLVFKILRNIFYLVNLLIHEDFAKQV